MTDEVIETVDDGEPWFASFPDDTKAMLEAKGWNTPDGVAKLVDGYKNLSTHLGDNIKGPPKESAEYAAWAREHLGAPEAPDGYTHEPLVPEGYDPEAWGAISTTIKTYAAENGWTPAQAEGAEKLANTIFSDMSVQAQALADSSYDENVEAVTKMVGGPAKYQEAMNIASAFVHDIVGDKDRSDAVVELFGAQPEFVGLMHKIATKYGEGKLKGDGGQQAMTEDQIRQKISAVISNPAYNVAGNSPEKQRLMDEHLALQELLVGDAPISQR